MSHQTSAEAEQAVRAAEAAQVQAVLDRDEPTLRTLWSPRLVVNSPANAIGTLSDTFSGMRAGFIHYHAYEQTIEALELFGDTAVVAGQEMVQPVLGPHAGNTVQRRFLDVWQLTSGRWMQIARQATVISVL